MTYKLKCYRHGEVLFVEAKEIPKEAKLKKADVIILGSGQNPHKFKGGKFYEISASNGVFGYLEAKDTKLYHLQHGDKKVGEFLETKLPDGIYQLRKGQEFINN